MACRKQGGNGWRRWLETLGLLAAGMELMFPQEVHVKGSFCGSSIW